jgi:hypothetical protein
MSFILDPRTKDLADPIPEDDLDDIRDYTFEQILKYAEKQERNACIEAIRTNSGVNEENPPLRKKLLKSMTGSNSRDPAFAMTCRRNVPAPVVTKRGGASVLRENVKKHRDDYLSDPALHLFVSEKNQDDGYNNPLEWWKHNHVEYSYVWQFARHALCIVTSSSPSERVFSCGANTVTNLVFRSAQITLSSRACTYDIATYAHSITYNQK